MRVFRSAAPGESLFEPGQEYESVFGPYVTDREEPVTHRPRCTHDGFCVHYDNDRPAKTYQLSKQYLFETKVAISDFPVETCPAPSQ